MRPVPVRPRRRRWLATLGFILLAAVLVMAFLLVSFPVERLRVPAQRELEARTGADVSIGELGLELALPLPRIRIQDLVLRWPASVPVHVVRLHLRPALSSAWLGGGSAWAVDAEGDLGRWRGTAELGSALRYRGTLRELDLTHLMMLTTLWQLQGALDADLDVAREDDRLIGKAELRAREGQIRIPRLVAPIPFDTLVASLRFGDKAFAELRSLELEGPLATLRAHGHVGHAPRPERAPLVVDGEIIATQPGVQGAMRVQGLEFDANGRAVFRVRGTLAEPRLE